RGGAEVQQRPLPWAEGRQIRLRRDARERRTSRPAPRPARELLAGRRDLLARSRDGRRGDLHRAPLGGLLAAEGRGLERCAERDDLRSEEHTSELQSREN